MEDDEFDSGNESDLVNGVGWEIGSESESSGEEEVEDDNFLEEEDFGAAAMGNNIGTEVIAGMELVGLLEKTK